MQEENQLQTEIIGSFEVISKRTGETHNIVTNEYANCRTFDQLAKLQALALQEVYA